MTGPYFFATVSSLNNVFTGYVFSYLVGVSKMSTQSAATYKSRGIKETGLGVLRTIS